MTYITARFGQPVAKPAAKAQIGFFGLRNIGPRAEARIGQFIAAAVAREGHVAKLPPAVKAEFSPEHYVPRALDTFHRLGRVTPKSLCPSLGLSEADTKRVLSLMQSRGLVRYLGGVTRVWERVERHCTWGHLNGV